MLCNHDDDDGDEDDDDDDDDHHHHHHRHSSLRSQSSLLQSSQQFAIYQSQVSLANYSSQDSRLKTEEVTGCLSSDQNTQDSRQSTVNSQAKPGPMTKIKITNFSTGIYNICIDCLYGAVCRASVSVCRTKKLYPTEAVGQAKRKVELSDSLAEES